MADNPEVIRQQMDETRSQLAEKLEALESQVSSTVEGATSAVSETVEAVKETVENVTETVEETVQSVGQVFDLRLQTERHPWLVFGGSVALGCLAAQLLGRRRDEHEESAERDANRSALSSASQPKESTWEPRSEPSYQQPTHLEPSENGKKSWFWEEVNRLKGLGVGAVMGVVRDLAARGLTGALGQRVAEEVDHLTSSLGGETIRGPLLPTGKDASQEEK
jgi:Protein of unknown function (DUF3618)